MNTQTCRTYRFGDYSIDKNERLLMRGDEVVHLPPKATDLLLALLDSNGHVITKDQLMERVWSDAFVEEANLARNIFLLRKTLGGANGFERYIETIPRRGYRFVAPVTESFGEDESERFTAATTVSRIVSARVVLEEEIDSNNDVQDEAAKRAPTLVRPKARQLLKIALAVAVVGVVIVSGAGFWLYRSFANNEPALPAMRIFPITSDPGFETNPALSSDGKLLAFSWCVHGNDPSHPAVMTCNIYVKHLDGGPTIQLTDKHGRSSSPEFSPDNRFVAYFHSPTSSLYITPAVGGAERKIFEARGLITGGWSPDGKLISFSAYPDSGEMRRRIYVVAVDTLGVRELTAPQTGQGDIYPQFSPDGNLIAFLRREENSTEIFVLDLQSGAVRQLTFDSSYVEYATWTADGKEIVFGSDRDGIFSLWRMPAEGGEPMPLPGVGDGAMTPSIAAKANRLAYVRGNTDTNVWRIPIKKDRDGNNSSQKLFYSSRRDESPALSPDGKVLAFSSSQGGTQELWIGSADGTVQRQLTSFKKGRSTSPSWSPDARQIAFSACPSNKTVIYVVEAEGGTMRSITDENYNSLAPSWSKDGSSIYFGSDRSGSWQIWRVPSAGGEALQITHNGGYEAHESRDGKFLYFNKAGYNTIGLFRLSLENGEETMILDLPQLNSIGDWALSDRGVYFIHRYDQVYKPTTRPSIKFLAFSSNEVSDVVPLPKDPTSNPGLSLSPDGAWLYYSIDDSRSYDIMLIENFR